MGYGCEDDDESSSFEAVNHVRHFESVFRFYDVDVHDWKLCSIADNCAVNKRLERLLDVSHAVIMAHKKNLEVHRMVSNDVVVQKMIESIHETIVLYNRKTTHRAILCNLTNLSPVLQKTTR